jgi:hypothetical protein
MLNNSTRQRLHRILTHLTAHKAYESEKALEHWTSHQDSRAKIVQILPSLEADEDEGVEYNREEHLRMVKLAQERKVVREGWVENHVMGYCCRCEQEVGCFTV